MPPKYPGTNVDIPPPKRPVQRSESDATPRNELVLQKIHEAEEHRVADITQVNLRLEKVERVVDRMELHLDAAEDRERAKERRAKRTKWIVTAVGTPTLVALIGSGVQAWGQVMSQSRATAKATAQQAVQSAQPATEDLINAAVAKGRQIEHDRWVRWELENPPPLNRNPDRVAGGAPKR